MNFLPTLIAAMMMVESGGDARAIGDGGRALGILQIHAGVVQDVNRIYKTNIWHEEAFDPVKAARICQLYLRAHAPKGASPEMCARIWNGGPRGHLKAGTVEYWKKVKRQMADDGRNRTTDDGRRTTDGGKMKKGKNP